jgi:hypothetical protein
MKAMNRRPTPTTALISPHDLQATSEAWPMSMPMSIRMSSHMHFSCGHGSHDLNERILLM